MELRARDEKDPQIVVNVLRPISDTMPLPERRLDPPGNGRGAFREERATDASGQKKLYLKIAGGESEKLERLKLVLSMFPGREQLVLYFEDTGKRRGAACVIHEALIKELCEMFGQENVVVK